MNATTTTNATAQGTKIEALMATMGQPTLKAFAGVFDLNPVRFYSVAKQPMEGVVYDAKVFNWGAVERFITRRLDAEKALGTLEEVITAALEVDKQLQANDGRRSTRGEGGTYGKKIEVDGKMIAERRFANHEMSAGLFVAMKKDARVYAIVLQTLSHTVLRPVKTNKAGPDFDFDGNDVVVISNGMLNFKGIAPSALDKALEERFSGEYAKQLAAEAAKEARDKAAVAEAAAAKSEAPKKA